MLQEVNVAYDNVKEVDCLDLSKEGTDSWEAALKRLVTGILWAYSPCVQDTGCLELCEESINECLHVLYIGDKYSIID